MRQLGPYQVSAELGRGAMGVVYRARRPDLDREVALKVIRAADADDPKRLARFLREARAAAALAGTPGIVTVHDVGEADGTVWFAMELVDGRSLEAHIDDAPIPATQAAQWLAALARAVGRAHERGILHRDLKPANVLVDRAGQPWITDFGLALQQSVVGGGDGGPLAAGQARTRLTHSNEVLGTPAYMPPEQARAEPLDATADVYALGATAYEMLTAAPVFAGDSVLATLMEVLHTEPDVHRLRRERVPRDLITIVLCCLEKDRTARYQSADDLADDCERFLRGEPVRARPVSGVSRIWRRIRQRPQRVGAVVAGALAMASLGAWAAWLAAAGDDGGSDLATARTEHVAAAQAATLADTWYALVRDSTADLRQCEDAFFGAPVSRARVQAALEAQRVRSAEISRPGMHLPQSWIGLATWLAGDREVGRAILQEAARQAPDDPLTQVFLARVELLRWLNGIALPDVTIRPTGVTVSDWRESPGAAQARSDAEAALDQAAASPLWATLRQGAELQRFVDAARMFARGDRAGAAAALAQLTDLPTLGDQAALLAGVAYLCEREYAAALRALRPCELRRWPLAHEVAAIAFQCHATTRVDDPEGALKDLDLAVRSLEAAAAVAPARARRSTALALLLRQRAEWRRRHGQDAVTDLRAALEACDAATEAPDRLRQRAAIGITLCRVLGDRGLVPGPILEHAVDDARAAADASPDEVLGWITLGLALGERSRARRQEGEDWRTPSEESIAAFGRALALDPDDAEARMQRGLTHRVLSEWYLERGRDASHHLQAACDDLDAVVAAAPAYAEAWANRAVALWVRAEQPGEAAHADALLAQARDDATRAIELKPRDAQIRLTRAGVRQLQGDRAAATGGDAVAAYRDALVDLDVACEENRASAEAFGLRANVHWALADHAVARGEDPAPAFAAAMADYGAALSRNPADVYPRYNRASMLMAWADAESNAGVSPLPRFRSALADYQQVCAQAPDYWPAHAGRGAVLAELGQREEAIRAFERALALNPNAPGVAAQIERLRRVR